MRESSTSLRIYFGIVGILYFLSTGLLLALIGLFGLSDAFGNLVTGSPMALFNTILGTIWSLGYLYFAFTLPSYLNPERVKYVKIFLLVPLASMLFWAAVGFLNTGQIDFITPVIGALITWYLYANVRRLANPPAPTPIQ
ncbi:MAG: hypothetical protein Q8P19_01465 [bacterium]|nr:hypothetical protein [bacterium]